MSTDNFFLAKALEGLGPVQEVSGQSGYFNAPDPTLDPTLFNGTVLKPEIRSWILKTFYDYFGAKYKNAQSWSTVWLAGSGISYQWSGDRGNGDLDVLIGVDFPEFFDNNLDYVGLSENELADMWNTDMKTTLWPETASTSFGGGKTYETTFYINPGSTDIRDIHPYAAYDVSHNTWTVKPPVLPGNPESLYPKEWWDFVNGEKKHADDLISRFNSLSNDLHNQHAATPGWANTLSGMGLVVDQARSMFDDIHLGRKLAFGPGGEGYGDFHNFRWQAHKRFGTMQALNSLAAAKKEAKDATEVSLYGRPLDNSTQALTKAALWNTPYRSV